MAPPLNTGALIPTDEESNAEVLLWQGRYRALFLPLVGFSTVTLKWFGVVSAESVYAERFGQRPLLLAVVGMMIV